MASSETSSGLTSDGAAYQLELTSVTKAFPGVLANDAVSLKVKPAEIHALLGENGAGKSTLVKMIYGILKPDAGEIAWEGKPVDIAGPNAARALGIGMVFQHFSLFDALTVSENIALALPAGHRSDVDGENLAEEIARVSKSYGLPLDPAAYVHDLSVGERQRIEIVRCLLQNPRLLIMDEPTSVLTPQEARLLFETLRRLSSEGCAILYISHKLQEIRELCETATILRGGRLVGTCDPREETTQSLARMMIGETPLKPKRDQATDAMSDRPVRLRVDGLSVPSGHAFGVSLKNISISVRAGEILGIAGVAGNGQSELMEAMIGEVLCDLPHAIAIDGKPVGKLGPRKRRELGVCFVPEERNGHATAPGMALSENGLLSADKRMGLTRNGWIDEGKRNGFASDVVSRFNVKTAGIHAAAGSLSGGNLQKFSVGREIVQEPGVLIVDQPTWGVDAGSAAFIQKALIDLAASGAAVIAISQDLDEIFAIADRIAVISEGKLSDASPVDDVTIEEIGLLMGGIHRGDPGDTSQTRPGGGAS